jgi:glutamyl endopeptidase
MVADGLAALSLAMMCQTVLAASPEQQTVSSDGTVPLAMAESGTSSAPFAGTVAKGKASDAQSEFAASTLSAAEMAAFRATYKAKIPPYASEAQPQVPGPDRRWRQYPVDSGFPYRAIGLLTFNQGGGGSFVCTGWLIGPNTVATAGHCVNAGSGGPWSTNVRFYPARNGASAPFGSCTGRTLFSVIGWVGNGNPEYDYGAVKLNCTVGNATGWFGFYATGSSQVGLSVLLMGYPADKPSATLWGGGGDIYVSQVRKTHYLIDTAGGQSGAPVIEADRGASVRNCFGACGVAIHAYGVSGGYNSGTRINAEVANNLINWRNAP